MQPEVTGLSCDLARGPVEMKRAVGAAAAAVRNRGLLLVESRNHRPEELCAALRAEGLWVFERAEDGEESSRVRARKLQRMSPGRPGIAGPMRGW